MTQALQKVYTFDEFVEFLKVTNENICYELYDGDIIQMPYVLLIILKQNRLNTCSVCL
jgi:Uma2 family endonuclease